MSDDVIINKFINNKKLTNSKLFKTFCPDKFVYCGNHFVNINKDELYDEITILIKKYIKNNNSLPVLFIKKNNNKNNLYICSKSLQKCKQIEDVLKDYSFYLFQ